MLYNLDRYTWYIRQADGDNVRKLITTSSQVGEIIRGRRKARGVPQQELAAKLEMSQSRLSTLEGNPAGLTLDRLLVLANLLDLELILQDKASGNNKGEW